MKYFALFYLLLFLQIGNAQVYDDYLGGGNSLDINVTSSNDASADENTINGEGLDLDIQGSSRFLAHATLGATIDDIETLSEGDLFQWIDDQMVVTPSSYTEPTIEIIFELLDRCRETLGDSLCFSQFQLGDEMWRYAWWHNTMHNEDKLRQRVTMALSEILVVSDRSDLRNSPHGLAYFYDILSDNAFGNYKDLLTQVSLSPAMGFYLSHMNNPKSIPILNIKPDENYAREIMQLFSIGLYELNQDGSRKTDPITGLWIPTYDNDDVKGLAKVFTGLSGGAWADEERTDPVTFGRNFRQYSVLDPMAMYEEWHELGAKTIVGDFVIPSGQTGMEDINMAIDHLFNHDNVGPFLATRLIQRLVKSNPSKSYTSRISAVFADNGSGVRGDLGAVIKAILTDEEALECYWIDNTGNGKLREPMMRYTQMMIGLQARTESDWFWNAGETFRNFTGQHVLSSPTVFNFYTPEYVPNSDFAYLNLVGPEYQILNSSTSSNYVNYMLIGLMRKYINDNLNYDLPNILNDQVRIYTENVRPYAAELSDEKWLELSASPAELVDYLDILLTNGQLSDGKKEAIIQSLERADIFTGTERAYYAAFMVMIDPDYVIMK